MTQSRNLARMTDHLTAVAALARELIAIDSRSFVSNLAVAERVEAELAGFEVERVDEDAQFWECSCHGLP